MVVSNLSQNSNDFQRETAIDTLRGGRQWVCFNTAKIPFSPATGREAKANDSTTWGTFETAFKAWNANPKKYAGIGREFQKEQAITGVDLDKCIDPETGELSGYARYVVNLLDSYTEYSPSGRGLHIWVYGSIPTNIGPDTKCVSKIEMYDCKRYFTWTGKQLPGTPATIEAKQEQLLKLHKETVTSRQQNRPNTVQSQPIPKKSGNTPYGLAALNKECQALATTSEGGRNHQLFIAACGMGELVAGNELTQSTVENDLSNAAFRAGLDDNEIEKTLRSGIERGMQSPRTAPVKSEIVDAGNSVNPNSTATKPPEPPPTNEILDYLNQGEWGDATLFTLLFRGKVVYDHVEKEWYIWKGHYWELDETGHIKNYVCGKLASVYIKTSAKVNEELVNLSTTSDDDITKARIERLKKSVQSLQKRAVELRMLSRCNNILSFSHDMHGMGLTAKQWDNNKWLLATPNGVIDLRTGECRDGQPTDYIRTVCPTKWQGLNAQAPRFEQFLQEIFSDREPTERQELIAFLHRLFGYGTTGEVREQIFVVLYGEDGRNGKDTLQRAISNALGSVSAPISKDVLLDMGRHNAGAPTPHLCALQGKRIAWANEPENGARFNVGQVKDLSGGGEIPVRPLFAKNFYMIKPTHLLTLLTNHKPHADANDSAFWDRLRFITFNMRFIDNPQEPNERKKDSTLWTTLDQEASGVLAWLVRGCLEWQRLGLATPEKVLNDGKQYREEEDNIGIFIKECCTTVNPKAQARASELYDAYKEWCETGSMRAFNKNNFGMLVAKKFKKEKDPKGFYYAGIGLLAPDDAYRYAENEDIMHTSKQGMHTSTNAPVEPGETQPLDSDYAYPAYKKRKVGIPPIGNTPIEEVSVKGMQGMQRMSLEDSINEPVEPDEQVCIPKNEVCIEENSNLIVEKLRTLRLRQWVNTPDGVGQITYFGRFSVDVDIMGKIQTLRGASINLITSRD